MKRKKRDFEQLFLTPIESNKKIAFISSGCLGDSLIWLVTANNFKRNGHEVEVFGDYLYQLKAWFPDIKIRPSLKKEQQKILQDFDYVLQMYNTELTQELSSWHPCSIVLSKSHWYIADMTMVDIQVTICREEFGLKDLLRTNAIQPLPGLNYRKYKNRIVVHPTSSLKRKNWPASKYIKLTELLEAEGYEVHFILAPNERTQWQKYNSQIKIPTFETLSDAAAFIYESAFFVGNDSGIGHLASNLGIPTVSLILRKGVAKQWRPTWAPGKVVLSPRWLNPRPIKEKLWKIFTSVGRVKKAFDHLTMELPDELEVL